MAVSVLCQSCVSFATASFRQSVSPPANVLVTGKQKNACGVLMEWKNKEIHIANRHVVGLGSFCCVGLPGCDKPNVFIQQ